MDVFYPTYEATAAVAWVSMGSSPVSTWKKTLPLLNAKRAANPEKVTANRRFFCDFLFAIFYLLPAAWTKMPPLTAYLGNSPNSSAIARSSFNSATVAFIFERLKSLIANPCTTSIFCPLLRTGKEQINPLSIP